MCGTCGCGDDGQVTVSDAAGELTRVLRRTVLAGLQPASQDHAHSHLHGHEHHDHDHAHPHPHPHPHSHSHDGGAPHVHGPGGEVVSLETAVLAQNDRIAARNRGWFEGRGVLALNLVSSPGAGKTTLLEETIRRLSGQFEICVIEGDQMTANDASRIRAAGARAVQINTGAGCHLEADMVAEALAELDPPPGSMVMIENVGNLVCPAMFDLGERMKVAVISTPEGDDKPLKYPHMFRAAGLVVINKTDLAPYVRFDEASCRANILSVNPTARILSVSALTGEGMEDWLNWLEAEMGGSPSARNGPRMRG